MFRIDSSAGCIDPVREGWPEGIPQAVQRPLQALRAAKTGRTGAGHSARAQVPAEEHLRVLDGAERPHERETETERGHIFMKYPPGADAFISSHFYNYDYNYYNYY